MINGINLLVDMDRTINVHPRPGVHHISLISYQQLDTNPNTPNVTKHVKMLQIAHRY